MHRVHHGDDVLHRSFGKNAVAQIENMTGPTARLTEDIFDAPTDFLGRGQQSGRVKVSLNANIVSQNIPSRVELDAPVDSDDVAAGGADRFEKAACAGAKVNDGNARGYGTDGRARLRQHVAFIIVGR